MRPGAEQRISVCVYEEKENVVFLIEDNGIGIAAADLPHIFERFWRAKNSGGRSGSGLGLAIARHIVQRHKGTLTVASTEGAGTKFVMRLPRIM